MVELNEIDNALLAFDPNLPGMLVLEAYAVGARPTYSLMCKLRRRGLAECWAPTPQYRGKLTHQWRLTGQGEARRAILAQAGHTYLAPVDA